MTRLKEIILAAVLGILGVAWALLCVAIGALPIAFAIIIAVWLLRACS